jgi:hypothetical protein
MSLLRKNPLLLIPIALVGVVALAIAWWLASPLFINQTVNEAFPMLEQATLPANVNAEQAAATMVSAAASTAEMDEAMPPSDTTLVKAGMFRNGDSFHTGSGDAMIYQLADGTYVLRFDNFQVLNGPDLHVYLSQHPDPQNSTEANQGYMDLGSLKGNIGSQNYALPADFDPSLFNSVVIYCQPFHVVFSVAALSGE